MALKSLSREIHEWMEAPPPPMNLNEEWRGARCQPQMGDPFGKPWGLTRWDRNIFVHQANLQGKGRPPSYSAMYKCRSAHEEFRSFSMCRL